MIPNAKPSPPAPDWSSSNTDNHINQGSALTSGKGIVTSEGQGVYLCAWLILKFGESSQ